MRNTTRVFEQKGYSLGIPMTNLVTNGKNFVSTIGWSTLYSVLSTSAGLLIITGNGGHAITRSVFTPALSWTIGKRLYYSIKVRVTNSLAAYLSITLRDAAIGGNNVGSTTISAPIQNQWYTLSLLGYNTLYTGIVKMEVDVEYADAATANGQVTQIEMAAGYDLTATFGAGNEPTVAEMDAMTATWFNGTAYQPLTGYLKSIDRSRYANNVVLSGGANWKKVNDQYVLDFTNPTAKATIAKNASINDMAQFTFRCWFYYGNSGEIWGQLFSKTSKVFLINKPNNRLYFVHNFTTQLGAWFSPVGGLATGRWHCVELSYDNTSVINDPMVYINGLPIMTSEFTTPIGSANYDAAYDMTFGNRMPELDHPLNGYLSDIQILNRISTAAEAKRFYNSSCRRYGLQPIA